MHSTMMFNISEPQSNADSQTGLVTTVVIVWPTYIGVVGSSELPPTLDLRTWHLRTRLLSGSRAAGIDGECCERFLAASAALRRDCTRGGSGVCEDHRVASDTTEQRSSSFNTDGSRDGARFEELAEPKPELWLDDRDSEIGGGDGGVVIIPSCQ